MPTYINHMYGYNGHGNVMQQSSYTYFGARFLYTPGPGVVTTGMSHYNSLGSAASAMLTWSGVGSFTGNSSVNAAAMSAAGYYYAGGSWHRYVEHDYQYGPGTFATVDRLREVEQVAATKANEEEEANRTLVPRNGVPPRIDMIVDEKTATFAPTKADGSLDESQVPAEFFGYREPVTSPPTDS